MKHNVNTGRTIKVPTSLLVGFKLLQLKEKSDDLLEKEKPIHHYIYQWFKTLENDVLMEAEAITQKKNNQLKNETE